MAGIMLTPVLFLPGLLCDATLWRAQIDDLADVAAPMVAELLQSLDAADRKFIEKTEVTFATFRQRGGSRTPPARASRCPTSRATRPSWSAPSPTAISRC